ncbi:hypothetical protein MMC30_002009 [Trapelia coarctata]|nr:hypothetical protein [Trapelia coarctata]
MPNSRSRSRSPRPRREEHPKSRSPRRRREVDERPGSHSRSPRRRRDEHPRSRSPRRRRDDDRPRKSGGGGFKWKEKRRDDDPRNGEDERRLERGYRNHDRPRSPFRDREQRDREQRDKDPVPAATADKPKKEKKEKREKKAGPVPTGEPMIIVNVNDRLGTKASIPCLASDSIKLFKAQVAAQIGREPHEIMLKRQGERPFNDKLTLEDYGISNGVQLDLEVDTGD